MAFFPSSFQSIAMRIRSGDTVSKILSSLLILVWVYAAISKLMDFEKFKLVLTSSPLIGSFAYEVAVGLPIMELFIAALLFVPKYRLWGLSASLILMLVLTAYLGYMITFVPHLPCSCGGILERLSWTEHLVFNICLTIVASVGLLFYRRSKNLIAINSG